MTWLDSLIAPLAPGWAVSRARARLALAQLRNYEAAKFDRREKLRASQGSANAETARALPILRARSRHFVRNNPYAAAAIEMLAAYQVGTGIMPRSATGDVTRDREANRLWAEWTRPGQADITGMLDFYGLQEQAARERAEAGECLLRIVHLSRAEQRGRGLRLPFALQAAEPDFIDSTRDARSGDASTVQGVEHDRWGKPTGYWLLPEHPGEPGSPGIAKSTRVDADGVLHVFRQLRAGQVRGVPDASWILLRLAQLDRYEDATLEQALVQACLAVFVTADSSGANAPIGSISEGAGGQREESISTGMITYLRPGESVETVSPGGNGGTFRDYARHQLTAIATGWGLTYDLLTGDLSQANYSSLRAGRLAFKRRLESQQWLMLIPRLCQPVWDSFIAACQIEGLLPSRGLSAWPVEWTVPRFEMVDPLKDTQAEILQIRAGLKPLADSLAENGYGLDAVIDQAKDTNAKLDAAGVVWDSDPRKMSGSGNPVVAPADAANDDTADAPPPTDEPKRAVRLN